MPHPVLQQLYDDHGNFRRLMALLTEELASTADPGVLRGVMNYMVHYADQFHHPLEDLLFARLQRKDPSVAASIEKLEQEHADIGKAGASLLALFTREDALTKSEVEKATVLAREYIDGLNRHRELEERTVFPLANIVLETRDFEAVRTEIKWQTDPVFGPAAAAGYLMVLERLLRH
ncbi:MAG: hemerythrin domain-containing protein [Xanthomonadaceae bacterium]|nr:hemerythrin domain-containing protein [Xanthomonadaceae bacterium]